MNSLELHWLPEPPDTLRQELKALRDDESVPLARLRQLATTRLNASQLHAISKALARPGSRDDAPRLKLALLSNASSEMVCSVLPATALRHDLLLDVQAPAFGTFMQEALDSGSPTNMQRNDFVLLALDQRAFGFTPLPGDATAAETQIATALETLHRLVAALQAHSGATVIVQTLPAPAERYFGGLELQLPGTLGALVEAFNARLRRERAAGTLLFDVAALASQVGLAAWHDPTQWVLGKFPFAHAAAPLYAEHLSRLLMAARGKAKKCLVLDLDNTLWGGVIGDDGLAGIVLGQGNPVGEAHLAVQATALALRERGVVLAVSSKNDEAVARQVFKEHPEMLLREEHIAVFQANWEDKASNLRAIARALNIGLDALVFLDDNPAERQQVRLELPIVGVPELPEAPELFSTTLLAAGYFESVAFTEDDRQRAGQYQANAARAAALGSSSDLGAYLESLQMDAIVGPFDAVGRARIAQLINKTNQFNLTTRRYTEAQVAALEVDPEAHTMQVRLRDRFGDNGIISILICRLAAPGQWRIDTWLMSCRVLNRGVERQILNLLVEAAAEHGISQLLGEYRPTEKNGMVKDHYAKLGFQAVSTEAEGSSTETLWRLDVAGYVPVAQPIAIGRSAAVSGASD